MKILENIVDTVDEVQIQNEDGNIESASICTAFQFEENGPKYLVYTHGDEDEDEMVTVEVVEFEIDQNGSFTFHKIDDEATWEKVKEALREIIKEETRTEEEIENLK